MAMAKPTDLTIVILSFNTKYWLEKTLTTLKEHFLAKTQFKVKTVVVDNNSQDGSAAMVAANFDWVELIQNTENSGYAAGNNLALEQAQSRYVMLLNSDVEFTTHSNLDPLIEYLDEHHQVAVITPRVELISGQLDPASHRGEPTLWASFTYFSGLEKIFPHSKLFGQYHQWYQDLGQIHQVDACSGAAMIVRQSAIDQVGLLDERFFMYAEDLDWCKRFREAGYNVIFHPGATVIHHKYKSGMSSSSTDLAKKTNHHFYDTMLQYYDKHYHHLHPSMMRTIIKYILSIKKGLS
jgi:GT2 family glycosyltransferase